MSGSRGSHGEGPTSRKATQADGILLAAPKQEADSGDWRSRGQLEPATPSTSPSYWSDDDTEPGVKPTDLYGKFTWKIENFTEISKRELRSNVFEVGNFKWYILVYPHGCDVCNHLSLFLCVADYDKLLPGWSHFAQFTIAVVNKDPKKSKYSDTLHRFCKKEHDWGWKKFMERSKIGDGFTVADTLVIKAQVQVIKEAVGRPFRCLDSQYRRELVRVYLTNVEGICRRFVEEKREKLSKLVSDELRFASFRAFWAGIKESQRKGLSCEKTATILKSVVKKFFNEKEVTSTLVMDALFSGTKSLERGYKVHAGQEEWGTPTVWLDKEYFVLSADVLTVLDRAVHEPIPAYKDDKGSGTPHRVKESGLDELGRDSAERDERRLQELGRRTVEMFVLSHLFSNRVEVAYREAVALKRQEELIREEEEAEKQAAERVERETADKEKKQSKKQKAKQRKKDRLQKEEDERRARLELEQLAKKEKEIERKAARAPAPPAPAPEEEDTESDETSQEDVDDELDEGEMSDEEEAGPLGEEPETLGENDDVEGVGEADEEEGPGPATVEDAEEEEDEWQEAEPAFRAVTVEGSAVTGGRSRRRRNKKKKGVESNEVVGGAGPLPIPAVGEAKLVDEVSSTGSGESAAGKGALSGGVELHDIEKQVEESDKRPSGAATPPDMDGPELEERVASAGAAGAPSSSGAEEYDSHEAEAIIASLRERVSWLEDRLKEKEDEVVVLQEQLRQQVLPNGLPSAAALSRPSSALSRTSSTAASVGPANAAVAQKAPPHALSATPTGPGVRGVVTPPQQAGVASRGANAYPIRAPGGRPGIPGSAREDPPAAASAAAAAAAAALSRPMSAPGNGPLLRHISGPIPAVATPSGDPPQLARSLSSAAPGGSARVVDKPPTEQPSAPVAPSYRNAAAGKIRGGTPALTAPVASSATLPSSLAAFPPIGGPPQIVTQQGGSSRGSSLQPSPPVTPSSQQESPSSSPATPQKSAPGQEQAAAKEQPSPGGGLAGKRGAVYAPPMHATSPERAPSGGNESGGKAEAAQPEGKGIKFGSVTADVLPPRSPRAEVPAPGSGGQDQQAQHQGVQRASQPVVGMTPPHAVRSAAGGAQPHMDSPGLSEDFPHLSLINDLLDDDLLGMGGLMANGHAGQNQQGGYNALHSQIPPQILARKLHPGASPFSPASAAKRTETERGGSGGSGSGPPQANGLSHHQQKPQQPASQQGPPQHHYPQHPGNNNGGSGGGGHNKNGPPEYASAGGMQRAQQLRHTRSLPPGVADGLLSNGHMGHPPMYWVPNSGAYPPPGMHGVNVNGPLLDKNGMQAGVPPGYQMSHANYGQFAPAQQPLPPQHQ